MVFTLKGIHGKGLRLGTALVAAVLFIASLLVVPIEAARAQSLDLPIIVSEAQAQALIARGAKVLDLRSSKAYTAGHMPGAISFPWRKALNVREVDGIRNEFASDEVIESAIASAGLTYEDTLLVYGNNALPGGAYVRLEYAGFGGRIHVLDGGAIAWNGEFTTSPVSVTPSSFRMTRKSDPRVDMAYVASKIGAIDATIIDGRAESAYADGHIPTARSLPHVTLMTAKGRLKPIDDVVQLFQRAGLDPAKQVVAYCGSGPYASSNFLALRNLGYKNIAFYDPGWDEWSREPNAKQEISFLNYTFGVAPIGTGKGRPGFVDRKELQAAIDDNRKTVVIVDVRSPDDYDWGHIPTAVNVFWNDTVDANRNLLPAEKLRDIYEKAGLSPSKRVIIFARGGFQLTHTYAVLRMLGYRDIDFFSGKFEGWKAK
jgi:thiosulfate/3-mercaptopyruvate sulfurtransferase